MLAGHLEETAPKGVTELTVQMGLSPVLVTGVNSVPGGIFRSLCLYSEGFPPLSFRLFLFPGESSQGKRTGLQSKPSPQSLSFYRWEKPKCRG